MKLSTDMLRLYAVTDRSWCKTDTLLSMVEAAINGGATMVQLREKELAHDEFMDEAREIKALCRRYSVPLIINDAVDIAIAIGADGVHVGQDDMDAVQVRRMIGQDMILGVTAKTVEQALAAQAAGADYLGSGAVFGSTTKLNARPMSKGLLRRICKCVDIPVVAIGGIDSGNILELAGTGIAGVAVVSGIFASEDIASECRKLRRLAEKTCCTVTLPAVLTIAGSDSIGGAGIQADIKTMTAHGVYAMSALTALTAQNTFGVNAIMQATPEFVEKQMQAVFDDIRPDAVKTGMLASGKITHAVAASLSRYGAQNLVVDPVMVATSGSRLIDDAAVDVLMNELLPIATLVTPNIPEAEVLTSMNITCQEDMENTARMLSERCGCAVLVKGGHRQNTANDFLWDGEKGRWFGGKRIDNPNTHGTGCTLSSAIASNLAKGYSLEEAVMLAKDYISDCLLAMLDMGTGSGPMNHMTVLNGRYMR